MQFIISIIIITTVGNWNGHSMKIKENENRNFGFDAQNGKYCDMIESGIIDPVKVTISALESAVSIASTMLTTSAIVVEKDTKTE